MGKNEVAGAVAGAVSGAIVTGAARLLSPIEWQAWAVAIVGSSASASTYNAVIQTIGHSVINPITGEIALPAKEKEHKYWFDRYGRIINMNDLNNDIISLVIPTYPKYPNDD